MKLFGVVCILVFKFLWIGVSEPMVGSSLGLKQSSKCSPGSPRLGLNKAGELSTTTRYTERDRRIPSSSSAHLKSGREGEIRFQLYERRNQSEEISKFSTTMVAGLAETKTPGVIGGRVLEQNYVTNSSSSSDEDFETAPRTLVGTEQGSQRLAISNNAPNGQSSAGDTINNKIMVHGTAKSLVRALTTFNARQRENVIEIGFGGVLDLQVIDTSRRLGHWLVSHFHPDDMSLHLPSGSKISIKRDVVAVVFGLPCGTVTITERDSQVGATNKVASSYLAIWINIYHDIHERQYYVMNINAKNRRFDIIDHSSSQPSNKAKYGDALENLLVRAMLLRNIKPKGMQMAWRVSTNKHDSVVYSLQHMESFLGQEPRGWNCGLVKGDAEQLVNLRKRCMHDIIMAEVNIHKDP
nr:uncharacterized protein LOC109155623 isoform X2 [Ipomoea batatas]